MGVIARLSANLVLNSAQFRGELNKSNRSSTTFFKSVDKQSKAAAKSIIAMGAAATVAFGVSTLSAHASYEGSLADIRAKVDATRGAVESLSQTQRNAAKVTKFTATQTGEAATFLAQAGLNLKEIEGTIQPTLNLAAATSTAVQDSADIVTNVAKGMAVATENIGNTVDVLALTTARSNTNLTQLGEAFKYGTAGAIGFNMSVAETSALLGAFANVGLKGSVAGTALTNSWTNLARGGNVTEVALANVTGAATRQEKVLRRLGVATANERGELRKLTDIVIDLKKHGASEKDLLDIFGVRATRALLPLMKNGIQDAVALQTALNNVHDDAKRMAGIQMDHLGGDLLKMKSGFQEIKLILAEGGLGAAARSFTQGLTRGLTKFEPLARKIAPYLDEIAVGMAAVTGTVVVAGVVSLAAAFGALAVAVAVNPITWLAAGIGAAAVLAYKFRAEIQAVAEGFAHLWWSNVKVQLGWLVDIWTWAKETSADFVRGLKLGVEGLRNSIRTYLVEPFESFIGWLKDHLPQKLQDALGFVGNTAAEVGSFATGVAETVITATHDMVDASVVAIRDTATQVTSAALSQVDEYIEGIKTRAAEIKATMAGVGSQGAVASGAAQTENNPQQDSHVQNWESWHSKTAFGEDGEAIGIYDKINEKAKESAGLAKAYEQKKWGDILAIGAKGSKAMAAIQKAFVVKSVIMDGIAAVMKAWSSAPFPANLPAVALTTAAAAGQLAAVIGQAHDGIDSVPSTGTYLLESGERVVDKRLNKDLSTYLAGAAGNDNRAYSEERRLAVGGIHFHGGSDEDLDDAVYNNRGRMKAVLRDLYSEAGLVSPI